MYIAFNDGIDELDQRLTVYQCGDCGNYFAVEDFPWAVCPKCIGERIYKFEPNDKFKLTGWSLKFKEEKEDERRIGKI